LEGEEVNFVVRRKDPPAYEGAKTFWQTVATRKTLAEANKAKDALKKISKPGTVFWAGEEKEYETRTH
jgi:hypothetical protein